MNNYYYAEKYMQQHRQELMREAEQMRLANSARSAVHDQSAMNPFSGLLRALSLRLRSAKQIQPKAITSQL